MKKCRHIARDSGIRQRGYTLIEIMVALLIALFLLAGLSTLVAGTRRTSTNQTALAQLQDQERLAMSMVTDSIQHAGYFDGNTYWTAAAAFPSSQATTNGPSNVTLAAAQVIAGSHTSITAPDVIAVRYSTTGSDGIINCNGGTSTTATTYVNFWFVNTTTSPNQLQCSVDGNANDAVTLVNNVVNLQVWYGVSTVSGVSNPDTYMTADTMTATAWANVVSARVTMTFNNPLYKQPGQPQYVYFTRLIALQNRTG